MLVSPDFSVVRRRATSKVVCRPGAIVNRGIADLKPKRLDLAKVTATLMRQLGGELAPVSVHVFGAAISLTDVERFQALTPDVSLCTFNVDTFATVLDALTGIERSALLLAVGERRAAGVASHDRLTKSLVNHSRNVENRLGRQLIELARDEINGKSTRSALYTTPLVVEEKPGKALCLSLEEASLRHRAKTWGQLVAKTELRPPVLIEAGFGIGGIALSPFGKDAPSDNQSRTVSIAAIELRARHSVVEWRTLSALSKMVNLWLRDIAAPALAAFKQVYLAIPSLAISAKLSAEILAIQQTQVGIVAPDLMLGWQPTLTAFEMLAAAPLPALLLHTDGFPNVHIVAIWS